MPDLKRRSVFKSGMPVGLNGLIPLGGQLPPNSSMAEREL
jgi:hypothetical protein